MDASHVLKKPFIQILFFVGMRPKNVQWTLNLAPVCWIIWPRFLDEHLAPVACFCTVAVLFAQKIILHQFNGLSPIIYRASSIPSRAWHDEETCTSAGRLRDAIRTQLRWVYGDAALDGWELFQTSGRGSGKSLTTCNRCERCREGDVE